MPFVRADSLFLSNKLNGIEHINVFSTSSFCDLGEMYKTFKVKGNQVQKESTCYKEADLRTGRKIYEDYCSKRNI